MTTFYTPPEVVQAIIGNPPYGTSGFLLEAHDYAIRNRGGSMTAATIITLIALLIFPGLPLIGLAWMASKGDKQLRLK